METLYFFPRAAITNCNKLSGFKEEKNYFHILGEQRPQIKELVTSGGSEGETAACLFLTG